MSLSRARVLSAVPLLLMALVIVFQRLHTYNEPLERDLAIYSVIAQGLREGRVLYADLWDIKPPGVYYLFALAQWLSGGDLTRAVFGLGVGASWATLLGLFVAVLKLTKNHAAALWAGAFWTAINNEMLVQANQPNTEVFLGAFLVWALVPLIDLDRAPRPRALYLSFGLLALASTIKQITLIWALLWLGLCLAKLARPMKKHVLLAFVGAFGLVWVALGAFFAAQGAWDDFRWTMLDYARIYTSVGGSSLRFDERIIHPFLYWLWPLATLCLLCPVIVVWFNRSRQGELPRQRLDWNAWLLIAFVVATPTGIWLPNQFFPHYYQLWLPLVCLITGWSVATLLDSSSDLLKRNRFFLQLIPLAALVLVSIKTITDLMLPASAWSRTKYGPVFQAVELKSKWLDSIAPPNTLLYQYGIDAGFNFYSHFKPASGVIVAGVATSAMPDRLQQRVLRDLERNTPEICVVTLYFPHNSITQYLHQNYVSIESDGGPHVILARKNSPLLRSLNTGAKPGFISWLQAQKPE